MKKSEVAALFAVIIFYDARVQFDEGKLIAWHMALDEDMTFEFGRSAVIKHYADTTTAIMPAMINEKWRSHKQLQRDIARSENQRLQMQAVESVPIPEDVKRELLEKFKSKPSAYLATTRTNDASVEDSKRESASHE